MVYKRLPISMENTDIQEQMFKKLANICPMEQYVIDFVHRLRVQNHLKQSEIAEVIGTKGSFVANVESPTNPAKYNIRHISCLARYFKLSPRAFFPPDYHHTKYSDTPISIKSIR